MKLPKLKCGDVIEILWVDIKSDSEWHTKEAALKMKPASCSYAGYFLNQDKACMRCMNMQSFDDEGCDYNVFPLGVITKVNILKKSE